VLSNGINVVEQNASPSGLGWIPLSGKTLGVEYSGLYIKGILHAKKNPYRPGIDTQPIIPAEDNNKPGPHAVAQSNGVVDVFWRNQDGGLGHDFYNPSAAAAGWQAGNIGSSTLGSDPFAVAQGDGTIDVFWRTPSSGLGHDFYNGSGWHQGDLGSSPLAS